MPPSKDAARLRPCAPPSDQRFCCQALIRFRGLVGLTARYGSAAVSVYSVPVAGTPSQPALNVEACETRTWVTEVTGPTGGVMPPPPPPHAVTSVRSATLPTPRAAMSCAPKYRYAKA